MEKQKNVTMKGAEMGYGMGFGWIAWIVILVLVVLAMAALIKYLRK